jgi:drug/metabolite transporter (DMT)-like permease
MQSVGIAIAFAGTIFWAISIFPFTRASRLMTVASMNLFRLLAGTVLVGLLAALVSFDNLIGIFSEDYLEAWLWMGLSGIVALGLGDYFNYRMYVILTPRYGSVLATLSPASALLFGSLLLNEDINTVGILGLSITIMGIVGMSLGRSERNSIPDHGHGSILSGIMFGLISALCNGAGLAFSKRAFIEQTSAGASLHPITGSFMRFLVATVVVVLITALSKKLIPNLRNIRSQPGFNLRIAFAGILFGPLLGVSCAMIAIQYIDVAVAQTIFALVPVVALIIAHFLYKEKITQYAIAGVIIAIAGVMILIWRIAIMEWLTFLN